MREPPRHPGELLAVTLAAAGMTQADLARRTGLSTKHVNQVVQGVEDAIAAELRTALPATPGEG